MKKTSLFPLFLFVCLLFSNCASVFNGKYQNISVFTNHKDAKVSVDDKPVGKGKFSQTRVQRDIKVRQLKVEAPGYKPEYTVAFQEKKSPLHIMSFIPFGVLLFPPLYDFGPKSWNYQKEYTINPKIKINARGNDQKYIYLKNTSFDVKKEDLVIEQFSHKRYTKNKESKNVSSSEKEIEIDNSIFTDALNDILKKNGYVDTTKTVLKSKTNTLFISATVGKITFRRVTIPLRSAVAYNAYFIAETTVEWDLLDIYEQSKFKKTIVSKSGEFASNFDFNKSAIDHSFIVNCVEDALTIAFFQFLDDDAVKKLLSIDKSKKQNLSPLKVLAGKTKTQTLKNAQASTVSVVTKKGHGSGCLISEHGHMITNYHVIAGQKELEVILNNGDKYKASVIRVNEDADIALLAIENPPLGLSYFQLPLEVNYEVGDEVFAIGTPKSLELSQTLSKGIISGLRNLSDNTQWIQTDVSVNPGNSGGALVSKQGVLLGIVNSKLLGFGVEGISFCIPAVKIDEMLTLE